MATGIRTSVGGSKATVVVEGRLDVKLAPSLDDAIQGLPEEVRDIEVDFEGVSFVSSAGLRALVKGNKLAGSRGGSFCVTHPCEDVRSVLVMTGISDYIPIVQ